MSVVSSPPPQRRSTSEPPSTTSAIRPTTILFVRCMLSSPFNGDYGMTLHHFPCVPPASGCRHTAEDKAGDHRACFHDTRSISCFVLRALPFSLRMIVVAVDTIPAWHAQTALRRSTPCCVPAGQRERRWREPPQGVGTTR